MATEVCMPRQGQSVESCLILEWKKNEGDPVKTGEILCEVETDKATFEVEAPAEGTLIKILHPKGADVPVLAPIAYIGTPGERISAGATQASPEKTAAPSKAPDAAAQPRTPAAPQASPARTAGEFKVSPRARNLAEAKGLAVESLEGTGPGGRVVERDVIAALSGKEPLTRAAAATAIASRLGSPAVGSGAGGRITVTDLGSSVVALMDEAARAQAGAPAFPGPTEEIPVKGIRKLIADRMLSSLASHAQLTLNSGADARNIQAFRKKLKESPEALGLGGITINDFVLYAASRRLSSFPELNAHWLGDKIVRFRSVHIGFAVDTPKGLMVPVIRNAETLSLKELSLEAKRLAKGCIEGGISPDELSGGTFTISNLGALGIDSFTPVLNSPQVAILGVCTIQPKPVMAGDDVKFVPTLGLSLTIDHQAVDGAPGARFLKELASDLANFDIMLAL